MSIVDSALHTKCLEELIERLSQSCLLRLPSGLSVGYCAHNHTQSPSGEMRGNTRPNDATGVTSSNAPRKGRTCALPKLTSCNAPTTSTLGTPMYEPASTAARAARHPATTGPNVTFTPQPDGVWSFPLG